MNQITITRKRSVCMREKFLVTGIGKRSVQVVLPYDLKTKSPMSDLLSEFELYWLLVETTKHVVSTYNWKVYNIKVPYIGYDRVSPDIYDAIIYVMNSSRHTAAFEKFSKVVENEHFLNDEYYCPKGFYIDHKTNEIK